MEHLSIVAVCMWLRSDATACLIGRLVLWDPLGLFASWLRTAWRKCECIASTIGYFASNIMSPFYMAKHNQSSNSVNFDVGWFGDWSLSHLGKTLCFPSSQWAADMVLVAVVVVFHVILGGSLIVSWLVLFETFFFQTWWISLISVPSPTILILIQTVANFLEGGSYPLAYFGHDENALTDPWLNIFWKLQNIVSQLQTVKGYPSTFNLTTINLKVSTKRWSFSTSSFSHLFFPAALLLLFAFAAGFLPGALVLAFGFVTGCVSAFLTWSFVTFPCAFDFEKLSLCSLLHHDLEKLGRNTKIHITQQVDVQWLTIAHHMDCPVHRSNSFRIL